MNDFAKLAPELRSDMIIGLARVKGKDSDAHEEIFNNLVHVLKERDQTRTLNCKKKAFILQFSRILVFRAQEELETFQTSIGKVFSCTLRFCIF